MAYSFNPFTGNLDIVGAGALVFEGEVETFNDLPETVGNPAVGASYLVRTSTGVWLVNKRQSGIWIRRNNTGVRATDWEYGGDYPVNSVNGQTGNVSLTAADVEAHPALVVSTQTITGNTVLPAGRNQRITLNAAITIANIDLPTSGNQTGDILQLVAASGGSNWLGPTYSIRRVSITPQTLATLKYPNESYTFVYRTNWELLTVDAHNHATNASSVALGTNALLDISMYAISNTAVGNNVLRYLTTASDNSAFGARALFANTAAFNSAFGSQALASNTTGQQNCGFGVNALNANITGSFNTAVGTNALISATGDNNTAIGAGANASAGVVNTIAIGVGATASQSGEIAIGSVGSPLTTANTAGAISTYLQIRVNGTLYKIPLHGV